MNLTNLNYSESYKQELNKIMHNLKEELLISASHNLNEKIELWLKDYHQHFYLWAKEQIESWFSSLRSFCSLSTLTNQNFEEIIIHDEATIQCFGTSSDRTYQQVLCAQIDYEFFLQYLCLIHKQSWNYQKPFVSFYLSQDSQEFRLSLMHHSLNATKKSKLFLRRIRTEEISITDFKLQDDLISFFIETIRLKKNIIICGATGSGKTSFLNALLKFIPENEHVIILEDTKELYKRDTSWTQMIARNSTDTTLSDYCAYAMRMKPSRIILGEMRSTEIVPFILSMSSGHGGLLSTIHAQNGVNAIHRLALLYTLYSNSSTISYETVMKLLCSNINYVVTMEDKKLSEVIKILGNSGSTPLYETMINSLPNAKCPTNK